MNVAIIGGAGFLGANLVRRILKEPGVCVTVMDSLEPRLFSTTENLKEVMGRITFLQGDVRDDAVLKNVLSGQDVIFNCAAQTSHSLSIRYPLLDTEINCLGNLKLLEGVRKWNRRALVVFPSSTSVIGPGMQDIVDEDHRERPVDIYSANKAAAEKYYRIHQGLYGLRTVVLRFPNLFGPYGKNSPEFGFINYFLHRAWRGETLEIFGSGEQIRNVMYVGDAVEALWSSTRDSRFTKEIFFAVSREHRSVSEIAEMVVRVLGRGQIKRIPWPEHRRLIEQGDARFTPERLERLTGWTCGYDLVSGLKQTLSILEKESVGVGDA
jgi:UDP-glucose 4-epimerase